MYNTIRDFQEDWQEESRLTVKLFSAIDDHQKSVKVGPEIRSLERLAWHITQTLTEMLSRAGLFEKDELEGKRVPENMSRLIEIYNNWSDELSNRVAEKWGGTDMDEMINLYGEMWAKGKVLSILVKHQIHHRGQMTTIMRMLGMQVPGLYGPSKEEWAQWGMEAQE